jgi:hypothetical protein
MSVVVHVIFMARTLIIYTSSEKCPHCDIDATFARMKPPQPSSVLLDRHRNDGSRVSDSIMALLNTKVTRNVFGRTI